MSTGPERFEGAQIYDASVRDLVNVPTAADRKAARVAVLREAHAFGLHIMPAADCPDCPAVDVLPGDRQKRAAARALERVLTETIETADVGPITNRASERFVEALGDYVLSRLHHNSHYGVADGAEFCGARRAHIAHPWSDYGVPKRCPGDLTIGAHKADYGASDANGPGYPCEGAEYGVCGGGPDHEEACPSFTELPPSPAVGGAVGDAPTNSPDVATDE